MCCRCSNPNERHYHRYGGRGIRVCDRWLGEHGFERFLADVGRRPSSSHSLDRFPNNDGDYEPGNVRWATKKEQANNTSTVCKITLDGVTMSRRGWALRLGITCEALKKRLSKWPLREALTRPVARPAGTDISEAAVKLASERLAGVAV